MQVLEASGKASAAELLALARAISPHADSPQPDHGSVLLRRPGAARVILDTSAMAAIFYGEAEQERFTALIAETKTCRISAASAKDRHPAVLNFGDCFAYALARDRPAASLHKGADFARTDIAPAAP